MICDDAGPTYAINQGWSPKFVGEKLDRVNIILVDNRLEAGDFDYFNNYLQELSARFFFKIGDGMQEVINDEYIKFLFSLPKQQNIFFFSPYKSSFVIDEIIKKHGKNKFITIPYAYNRLHEIDQPNKRKNRILVSGNVSNYAYPLRWKFHTNTYNKIWSFGKTKYLKHPGYPDIGNVAKHKFVGNAYINLLSQYEFMLTTTNIWNYELLKYRECGYAGCILVGNLPDHISIDWQLGLIDLKTDVKGFVNKILKIDNETRLRIVENYREWFRKNRNPEYLNAQLFNFLALQNEK